MFGGIVAAPYIVFIPLITLIWGSFPRLLFFPVSLSVKFLLHPSWFGFPWKQTLKDLSASEGVKMVRKGRRKPETGWVVRSCCCGHPRLSPAGDPLRSHAEHSRQDCPTNKWGSWATYRLPPGSHRLRAACGQIQPPALPVCRAPKLSVSHSAWENLQTQRGSFPHWGGNSLSSTAAGEPRGGSRDVGRILLQYPLLYLTFRSYLHFLNSSVSVITTLSPAVYHLSVHLVYGIRNS